MMPLGILKKVSAQFRVQLRNTLLNTFLVQDLVVDDPATVPFRTNVLDTTFWNLLLASVGTFSLLRSASITYGHVVEGCAAVLP